MERVASQLLRAFRGSRSQVAFCRRLGYRSNVATDWEAGRRFPAASEALRAAEVGGIDVAAALLRFHPGAAEAMAQGVGAWLEALKGRGSQREVAVRCGASRHQVGRWLRGDAEPRLPDLLRLVDALTGRMPDLVASLVDVERVPAVRRRARAQQRAARLVLDAPWSPAVLALLATGPGAIEGLAARLGVPEEELRGVATALVSAGLVRRVGRELHLVGGLTSTVRGNEAERARLRRHWSAVAGARLEDPAPTDLFGFNVLAVRGSDLERIRELYRGFYREVRALVAASEPSERAALMVFHLVDWGGLQGPGRPRPLGRSPPKAQASSATATSASSTSFSSTNR